MAPHRARTKANAEAMAKMMRRKGFNSTVYKKEKGYGISVTRNIKK